MNCGDIRRSYYRWWSWAEKLRLVELGVEITVGVVRRSYYRCWSWAEKLRLVEFGEDITVDGVNLRRLMELG